MATGNRVDPSFDEQAALEELERLQRAIEESRRRRGETVDEFNAFVRSFKRRDEPAPVGTEPRLAVPPPPRPPVAPAADPIVPVVATPVQRVEPQPPPPLPVPPLPVLPAALPTPSAPKPPQLSVPIAPAPITPEIVPPPATVDEAPQPAYRGRDVVIRRRPLPRGLVAWVAVVVIVGAVALLTMWRSRAPSPTQPSASSQPAPASAPAAIPAARTAGSPPAAAATNAPVELVALRPVWVRVVADGQRTVERELKANERVPVTAQNTVTIRAGDAGALRVSIRGKDQGPVGPDGIVVNRTFALHPAPAPAR
jgi:hypothetical protein